MEATLTDAFAGREKKQTYFLSTSFQRDKWTFIFEGTDPRGELPRYEARARKEERKRYFLFFLFRQPIEPMISEKRGFPTSDPSSSGIARR